MVKLAMALVLLNLSACGWIGYPLLAEDGGVDVVDARDGTKIVDGATSDSSTPDIDASMIAGRVWMQMSRDPAGPTARRAVKLVYDEVHKQVLAYGGADGSTEDASDKPNDMWAYKDGAWSKICGPCAPGQRAGHGFVWDHVRGRGLLYGGSDETDTLLGDLWEWDGVTWTEVTQSGAVPGARTNVAMVWDRAGSRALLYGGMTQGGGPTNDLFELKGNVWTKLPTQATAPKRQDETNFASWSDANQELYVVAASSKTDQQSWDSDGYPDDAWRWNGQNWAPLCFGCTGNHAGFREVIWDPSQGLNILVGGFAPGVGELSGTLELEDTTFTLADPLVPDERNSVAMAYDRDRNVIVLFGGHGGGCDALNCVDTFEYRPE